LQNISLTKH